MFTKIFIFILSWVAALYILLKTEYIVREIGHNALAEKYLGPAGSYAMWKGIAILIMVISFIYLVGDLDWFIDTITSK
jgi:hypothetical protein